MNLSMKSAAVLDISAAALILLAPGAEANDDGKLVSVSGGYESDRWSDELYSQITFHGCYNSGTFPVAKSVDVQIWEDIKLNPDDSYDNKTYTACYVGKVSNGEWTDLPAGKKQYYFKIMKIGGSKNTSGDPNLDVDEWVVDTTKADG